MKTSLSIQEPRLLAELAEATAADVAPSNVPSPEWILILEDDTYCAHVLQRQIYKAWPKCLTTVANTRESFEAALEIREYDLILSDYYLPRYSGISALATVRERHPKTPLIFVSGAIGDDVGVECLKLGATDYIMKGRLTRLIPAIERALDETRKHRENEQISAQLAESNQEYLRLVNSVDGIVWQADQRTMQFTFISQQVKQVLGLPVAWWLQQKGLWQQKVHPDDCERVLKRYLGLNREQNHCQFEYRMFGQDGRTIWMRDNVCLILRADGNPQLQGITVDVTECKQAEAELSDTQTKLEDSNRDLLQRNTEIQNFYHTLSHELKTPLTSAREFVSLVLEGVAGPLTEEQTEYLGIAKKSCDQLRVCVNDLLDATRVETGKMSLELKTASLAHLVSRTVISLKSRAADCGITLSSEIAEGLPEITMDEHRITQTVTNLVNNAINHTPRGGKIKVIARETGTEFVQVCVTDTGCGISEEEQDRIFNRLYQIKTGDATTKNGIGLGLYLCKELVQLHGGDICVESKVGEGSHFKFILPKSQNSFRPDVLVVDDDRMVLELAYGALSIDYNVRKATDGEKGLEEIRKRRPDVIVLDLSMPNVNGVTVLREIRKNWDDIQVIVHTAYSNADIMRDAMDYSPFTLLSKPSSIDQLQETVKNSLRLVDTKIWNRKQLTATAALKK